LKEKVASIEANSRKALDEAIEESNLKVYPNNSSLTARYYRFAKIVIKRSPQWKLNGK